jgi:hypothetical protein
MPLSCTRKSLLPACLTSADKLVNNPPKAEGGVRFYLSNSFSRVFNQNEVKLGSRTFPSAATFG